LGIGIGPLANFDNDNVKRQQTSFINPQPNNLQQQRSLSLDSIPTSLMTKSHTFTPTDYETLTSWLAQYSPDDLPPDLQSFKLTPIQSSMGRVVVLLANLVCNFDASPKNVVFTKRERDQFEKLQCVHLVQRFHHLTGEGHPPETAASIMGTSLFQGTVKAITPLELSPRMLIEGSGERTKLRRYFENVLDKKAKEAEMKLLRELELELELDAITTSKAARKGKKKKHQGKKLHYKNKPCDKPVSGDDEKENTDGSTFAQGGALTVDDTTTETTKRVRFGEKCTNKPINSSNAEIKEGTVVKGILKKELRVDVASKSGNNILAHFLVPMKIDYEDRVSETSLPQPKASPQLSVDAITESIIPPMSPTRSHSGTNSDFSALVSQIEALKAENAQLHREVAAAAQKSTEAIQRVQLKAYIAETARDAAQERAELLEALLLEVIDGKIVGIELQEVLLGLQKQSSSPTAAASSLSSLLDRLPTDTLIHVNSSPGQKPTSIQDELSNHKGILSRLRQGDNTSSQLV
jgi:hypothetical protein